MDERFWKFKELIADARYNIDTIKDIKHKHVHANELKNEGNKFERMKRFGFTEHLQIPEHRLILPIPAKVINLNPYITQNQGY